MTLARSPVLEPRAHEERGHSLIGRAVECGRVDALIGAARAGRPGLVVVRGEPGSGKTALLLYAEERASEMQVLRTAGVRCDADVPFAGLLGLTMPLLSLLGDLPAPQREALEVAIARKAPTRPVDRLAVGAGTLSLFAAAARRAGIVVLVDDLHWVDPASAEAVIFAARRLADGHAVFVFALRDEETPPADVSGIPSMLLGPLDPMATTELAGRVRGGPVSREIAERIFAVTRGNPLAIAELRDDDALASPIGAVPVLRMVEETFGARAAALAPDARLALLAAAADEAVDLATFRRALAALGADEKALDEAERVGLIIRSGPGFSFRHPLVRSAVFQHATVADRRRVHSALADAVDEPACSWRRVMHRAAAAQAPDAELARALEQAGREACDRHAHAAAALAFERAAALTPPGLPTGARLLQAARSRWHSGDAPRAGGLLDVALATGGPPVVRGDIQRLRAEVMVFSGAASAAVDLLVAEAARIASIDVERAVGMLDFAFEAAFNDGAVGRAMGVAQQTVTILGRNGKRGGWALCLEGRFDEADAVLRRAIRECADDDREALRLAAEAAGWLGAFDDAHTLASRSLAVARRAGAPIATARAAVALGDLAFVLGDWPTAARLAHEALLIARYTGQLLIEGWCLWSLGALAAVEGRAADSESYLDELGARGIPVARGAVRDASACVRGLLQLCRGDADRAAVALERGVDLDVEQIAGTPITPAFDLVEARVRAGDRQGAQRTAEGLHDRVHAPWAVAALARSSGLLADAHEGDEVFRNALEICDRQRMPFEQARTQLNYGEWLRRAGRRADAREQLRAGLRTFDWLGAEPFAARARRELAASGAAVASRGTGGSTVRLTAQERRVAALAAEGLSNRDIAARLFVSTKTVEAHLHRTYVKLDVGRRTELAAALIGRDS